MLGATQELIVFRGIYRISVTEHGSARRLACCVNDDGREWMVSEEDYRALSCEPDFDTLLVRDDGAWTRAVQRIGMIEDDENNVPPT
jgi:hypothetical protein